MHGDGGQAAAAPDVAFVELVVEGCEFAQEHRGARRRRDLEVAQGLDARPLAALSPRYDVDEIDRIADLRDGRAGDHPVEGLGELFGAEPGLADPVLVDNDAQLLALLGPVVVDVAHEAGRAQGIRDLVGIVPRLIGRRCTHPVLCTGQPTGGPSSSREMRAVTSGKSVANSVSSLASTRSRASRSFATTTISAMKSLSSCTSSGR